MTNDYAINNSERNQHAVVSALKSVPVLLLLCALTLGEITFAKDVIAGVLEEVVVTARKREESLQQAPLSVTAVTGLDMERRNLTNLMEIGHHIPNVFTTTSPGSSGASSNSTIFIRGVGQNDFLFTTDPGVGVYVDGVYHPRTLGGVMDLLDLERVEVLRGPQGTLFGKNTLGGALSLVSKKPTGETGGYGELTFGRFDRIDFRGSVELPLVEDQVFGKVSLSYRNRDGYGKRRDFTTREVTDDMGDQDALAVRGQLRWLISDAITADLSVDYTRERQKSLPVVLVQFEPTSPLAALWNALVATPSPMSTAFIGDEFTSFGTGPNVNDLDVGGVNLTINWDLGNNLSLKSITGYREMEAIFNRDGDSSAARYIQTDQDQNQDQVSQEFQLNGLNFDNRLKWVLGAFYFNEHNDETNDVDLAAGLYNALEGLPAAVIPLTGTSVCPGPFPPNVCAGGAGNPFNTGFDIEFDIINEIDITSYAVFGQATYDLTDKLSVTAGVRYSYEEKEYFLEHIRANAGVPTVPATTVRDSWNSVTPMGGIDYKWTDDIMTYFLISEGFKSGGFNGRPTVQTAVESYEPETVTSYEIGAKTEWFDNRLRFNIAGFYADYTDVQLTSISADITGNLVILVQNAGEAEVTGFEMEMQAAPVPGLEITGAVGYTDFEYKKLNPGVRDITIDSKQVKSPEWTTSASVQYSWPFGSNGTLTARGDWSYASEHPTDVLNTPALIEGGYNLFSARLVYEHVKTGWELALFGTNLADERYIISGANTLASFGHVEAVYGRPREWGVSIKKSF